MNQITKNKTKRNRPRRKLLKGQGDYSNEVLALTEPSKRMEAKIDHIEKLLAKSSVKNLATSVGRGLGGLVGQGDLGALAGSAMSRLFGHGDYEIKSNSLAKGVTNDQQNPPKFSSLGKRGTRIIEREYLGDVISGGANTFNYQTFNINPTDPATFPWLSKFAPLYEQWEPNGIVFEFVTTSSEYNGTSQALGAVIMATEYDPNDPPYGTKQMMENADYACSTKPALSLLHGIECDPSERPIKILYTGVSTVGRTDSLGIFQIATAGIASANVTLGELWISYDLTFYKKQIDVSYPLLTGLNSTYSANAAQPLFNTLVTEHTVPYGVYIETNGSNVSVIKWSPNAQLGRYMVTFGTTSWGSEVFAPVYYGVIEVQTAVVSGNVVSASRTWRALVDLDAHPIDDTGYSFAFPNKTVATGTQWIICQRVSPLARIS